MLVGHPAALAVPGLPLVGISHVHANLSKERSWGADLTHTVVFLFHLFAMLLLGRR